MTHHVPHEPAHGHGHVPEEPVNGGLTGFAIIKYGFILVITIVVLYFIARYIIPLLGR